MTAVPEELREDVEAVREAAGAIAVARGRENGDASAEWQAFDDALDALAAHLSRQHELLREAEEAMRGFAESWDFHAADYLAELVDGEECRVLPASQVAEVIEQQRRMRSWLARYREQEEGRADGR